MKLNLAALKLAASIGLKVDSFVNKGTGEINPKRLVLKSELDGNEHVRLGVFCKLAKVKPVLKKTGEHNLIAVFLKTKLVKKVCFTV